MIQLHQQLKQIPDDFLLEDVSGGFLVGLVQVLHCGTSTTAESPKSLIYFDENLILQCGDTTVR